MPKLNLADGKWLNPPRDWSFEDGSLNAISHNKTDFWRGTHYGFFRDNGHFLALPAPRSFTATLQFEAAYENLYDQAGLMLRIDTSTWLKLGIEYSDGATNFSMVITRGHSDWSVIPRPPVCGPQTVRITRRASSVIAHFLTAEGAWQLIRVADFPDKTAEIGPMVCTPERAGLRATFSELSIGPAMENALHS